MKLVKYVLLFCLGIFSILSCEANTDYALKSTSNIEGSKSENGVLDLSKLIKNGVLEFEVEKVEGYRKYLFEQLKKHKAYIGDDRRYTRNDGMYNNLIIRVPHVHFDTLMSLIVDGVGRIDEQFTSVEDVTANYIDIEARIKNKKALASRYLSLLNQASNLTEVLEIERELHEVNGELESIEGQFKQLNHQINYATITLTIYEPITIGFGRQILNGFREGWGYLCLFLIYSIKLWPFIIIGFGSYWGLKKLRRR